MILIAKHYDAASAAQTAMERRMVIKTYYALLKGELKEPVMVDQPLGPDETSQVVVKTAVREGPGHFAGRDLLRASARATWVHPCARAAAHWP
ncbi:hypothetical protein EMGBD4_16980 [Verrucomicrobiota bacterium]|nr:hypothetical protein EMGBD4_16980 [Verrucomicrobiota bacterium]